MFGNRHGLAWVSRGLFSSHHKPRWCEIWEQELHANAFAGVRLVGEHRSLHQNSESNTAIETITSRILFPSYERFLRVFPDLSEKVPRLSNLGFLEIDEK